MSRKLKPTPKLSVAKRQPPKWQHERNKILIVWITIPLIIAVTLGLVGYWGYDTYVAAWNQTIVKIGNSTIVDETTGDVVKGDVTTVDMRYYVKMLRYQYLMSNGNISDTFPSEVLQYIETKELVKRGALGIGIEVSPDEVIAKINSELISWAGGGGNSTVDIAGNITLPQSELGKVYQTLLKQMRLSDSEYRDVVESSLLTQKLEDQITQSIPTEAKQVHVYAIKLANEGNATEIENRLQNGEDFTTLAEEFSLDETSKQYGGDLGWVPQSLLLPELDQAAFSLGAGNISAPLLATNGYYYIIKVSEIEESRTIDDSYRETLASNAFSNWFTEQRKIVEIREYLTQDKVDWAMDHIT